MENTNEFEIEANVNGWDLVIEVDLIVQFITEKELKQQISEMNGIDYVLFHEVSIYIQTSDLFKQSELKQNLTDLINAYLKNTKQ